MYSTTIDIDVLVSDSTAAKVVAAGMGNVVRSAVAGSVWVRREDINAMQVIRMRDGWMVTGLVDDSGGMHLRPDHVRIVRDLQARVLYHDVTHRRDCYFTGEETGARFTEDPSKAALFGWEKAQQIARVMTMRSDGKLFYALP